VIASDVGYGTLAHFNRQFLQRKGMTPRAFRASHQGAAHGKHL
jgi:AraC-like DNA-binding protein